MKILILITLMLLSGCSTVSVDENRAGCTFIDGNARYGSLTQYVKGEGHGVYAYVGEKLKGKVKVVCNQDVQEVRYD